jgi:hypothetical protein
MILGSQMRYLPEDAHATLDHVYGYMQEPTVQNRVPRLLSSMTTSLLGLRLLALLAYAIFAHGR